MSQTKLKKLFTDLLNEICSDEFEKIKGEPLLGNEYKIVEERINEELYRILPKWLGLVDCSGLNSSLMQIEVSLGTDHAGRSSLEMKPSVELDLFIKRLGE